MKFQLIRHATSILEVNGNRILVDPMLSAAGTMQAVPDVPDATNNPLVELPIDVVSILDVDAVLLTHTHRDHFDEEAVRVLDKNTPVFCQPQDMDKITGYGFKRVRAVHSNIQWNGLEIIRTTGQHGTGEIGRKMAPVSGYVIVAKDEPSVYITGDTILCPEVKEVITVFNPTVIVCFAGCAEFSAGGPITMTKEDVASITSLAPNAKVVAVHMESWNHCRLSRNELCTYVQNVGLSGRIIVPADGDILEF